MISFLAGIFARIFSNSFLNVFQKLLASLGESPSVINFYTYLGLTGLGIIFCLHPVFNQALLVNVLIMGILGAFGNYFIIKALSQGDLSELAPINSYKPIVAIIFGFLILGEIPKVSSLIGIVLIIIGTFILFNSKISHSKAVLYRFLALFFSGTEAIFIKKVIMLSDINSAFLYWAISGLIFSLFIALKHPLKLSRSSIKYQLLLIISVAVMQYSTNYVFSLMNVAYALALFQLSTILSVFLGVNVFKEDALVRKLIASSIMVFGAAIIILT